MDPEQARRHEAFVWGQNGTCVGEIVAVTSTGPLSVLIANLAIPWLFPARNFATGKTWDSCLKLLLDHFLLVVPFLLCVSSWSDAIFSLILVQTFTASSLALFALCEYAHSDRDKPPLKDALRQATLIRRPMFITYFRAYALISSGVCILAVDFKVFPRRFAKTETYGYGLMDIGVGMFIFMSGLVGMEARRRPIRLSKRIVNCFPLVVLGLLRLLFVKLAGYQEHVSEYGVHWNFFFTLASVQILSNLLSSVVPMRSCSGLLGVVIALGYEFVILDHLNLKEIVLFGDLGGGRRTGLVDSNREGLTSVLGYFSLHSIALQLGVYLRKERIQLKDWVLVLVQLCFLCVLCSGLLILCHNFIDPPSRRLANVTYVVWMTQNCLILLCGFLFVDLVVRIGGAMNLPLYSYAGNPFDQLEPSLACRINDKGLWYFVLGNVLTGVTNLSVDTLSLQHPLSTAILLAYSLLLSVIIAVLPFP